MAILMWNNDVCVKLQDVVINSVAVALQSGSKPHFLSVQSK